MPLEQVQPKWEVITKRTGFRRRKQYYARLVASNGRILCWTEYYVNKAGVEGGIASIQRNVNAQVNWKKYVENA